MEEEGVVSLWAGRADSAEALAAYMREDYSEDGDFIPPPFAKDFGIDYYDEDFREAEYFTKPARSIRQLLKGCSYGDVVIPKFVHLLGDSFPDDVNAVVMLYNFKHDTGVEASDGEAIRLKYMGAVKYDE
jgi:hypothetical protein